MRRFILYFALFMLYQSAVAQNPVSDPKGYYGTTIPPNTKLATISNTRVSTIGSDSTKLVTQTVDGKNYTNMSLSWFNKYMQQFVINSFAPVSGSPNYIQNQGVLAQSAQSWYTTAKFGDFPSGDYTQIDGSNIFMSGASGATTAQLNNGNLSLSKNGFNFGILSGVIGGYGSVATGNIRFADRLQAAQTPVDALDVVRKADLDSATAGKADRSFVQVDSIINDTFNRPATGFPLTGSNISQAIVGGKWQISNSTGNTTYDNFAGLNYITWLPQYEFFIDFNASTNGNGIGIGLTRASTNSGYALRFDMNAAGNRGTLRLVQLTNGSESILAISPTNAVTYTNGDPLRMTVRREGYRLIASVGKVGSSPVSLSYDASLDVGNFALAIDNNTLRVYSFGGTQLVSRIGFSSKIPTNQTLVTAGDSQTYGWSSNNGTRYYQTFQEIINNYVRGGGVLYAASAARSSDLLSQMPELLRLKPRNILLQFGINDALNAIPLATYQANMLASLAKMDSAGIVPYICTVIPTTNTTYNALITQYNTFLNTLSSKYTIIDTYTPLVSSGLLNAAYNTDGIHLNAAGHGVYASTVFPVIKNLTTPNPFRNTRPWVAATNRFAEPITIAENTSTTQGNGTSTFNRAMYRADAGNGAVSATMGGYYNTGGVGNAAVFSSEGSGNIPIVFVFGGTEQMRIASNGNLGLGTSAPLASGSLRKAFVISDLTNGSALKLEGASSVVGEVITTSTNFGFGTRSNHPIGFFTNNASSPTLVLSTGGRTLVGSSVTDDGVNQLQVGGSVTTNGNTITGKTEAAGDNSTKMASTAFVQSSTLPATLEKSANYTVLLSDFNAGTLHLYVDATSGVVTITLPSAATMGASNRTYQLYVYKKDSSGNAVVLTGSANINGASTYSVTPQYASALITSNTTQYYAK